MASIGAHQQRHLYLIDGLRGCAALAVVVYHYTSFFMIGPNHSFPVGYESLLPWFDQIRYLYHSGMAAVQLFWIISGFIFAFVYFGRSNSTWSFFLSRIARLYPLHFVTLLAVATLQIFAIQRFGHTLIYGEFSLERFVQHLFLASNWISYGQVYSFNGPIWSVSVEVLVYGIFWLLKGRIERGGLGLSLAIMAALALPMLIFGNYSRVFEAGAHFFLGVALCQYFNSLQTRVWRIAYGLGGLGLIILAGLAVGTQQALYLIAVPAFGCGVVLLLAALEPFVSPWIRGLGRQLGELSYGIYLWHIPVMMALIHGLTGIVEVSRLAQNGWFLLCVLAFVLIVARLSFCWFEAPARNWVRYKGLQLRLYQGDQSPKI